MSRPDGARRADVVRRWARWGVGAYGVTLVSVGAALLAPSLGGGATPDPDSSVVAADAPGGSSAPVGGAAPSGPVVAPSTAGATTGCPPIVGTARPEQSSPGRTAPFDPARIILPGGASAPVVPADVTDDGSLVIPELPSMVGIWTGGARPGDAFGAVVIAGHVDSARYGLGVLAQLKGARPGQVIELRATGRVQRYRITTTQLVTQQSLATHDVFFAQGVTPHRLIVITCGGPFDLTTRRYQDNYVVTAVPV